MDGASKATLENQFGTSNEDECMIKILEGGEVQVSEVRFFSFTLYSNVIVSTKPPFSSSRTLLCLPVLSTCSCFIFVHIISL